jgi:hypothetical protein
MLVSAFAGPGISPSAYANPERYRFYGYGDCMLICDVATEEINADGADDTDWEAAACKRPLRLHPCYPRTPRRSPWRGGSAIKILHGGGRIEGRARGVLPSLRWKLP